MFKPWDQLTVVEQLQSMYSDFFKDVYGFRPRSASDEQWASKEWLEEQLARLEKESARVQVEEVEAQEAAIRKFEKHVQAVIIAGAKSRETAVQWILDAADTNNDPDYFCYCNGLPYGYFKVAA